MLAAITDVVTEILRGFPRFIQKNDGVVRRLAYGRCLHSPYLFITATNSPVF